MTADMLHHHLDLTSANNLLTIHHHHHHTSSHNQVNQRHSASSVTSDQFSSLNLSSVCSSPSSAHHSPIMEHIEGDNEQQQEQLNISTLEGRFNQSLKLTLNSASNMTRNRSSSPPPSGPSSDYTGSQASIPPLSPLESITSGLSSPEVEDADATTTTRVLVDHTHHLTPAATPASDLTSTSAASSVSSSSSSSLLHHPHHHHQSSTSSHLRSSTKSNTNKQSHHHNYLHPNDCQQQQKVRSFSHTTSYSPFEITTTSSGVQSRQASPTQVKVADGNGIVERPQRRLSRIENRQSLHDLGYGQIESYFKLQRLGKGTYATVYMGRSRVNNDLVALKEILKEHDEGAPCTAIREVSLLRLLRHNNIVTLHDICHTPKKLTLVFEYVGPDLYAYMKENNHLLSIHNVRLLLFQLLRGISFCHTRQVLHRDLKPQNLLINTRGELKICDFGLARAKSIPTKSYSNEVVTLWYRPPDVLLGNTDYDHSIDMWGVGCIFYEMASGRTFFPGSNVRQQLYLIFSSLGAPNCANWPEILANPDYLSYSFPSFRPEKLAHRVPRLDACGVQLLQSFLRFKPSERLSAHEAMRDPFFACLPAAVHALHERESIFDVPGVYMTLNPGQKFQNQNQYQQHHQQQQQQQSRALQQQQEQINQQYFHSH